MSNNLQPPPGFGCEGFESIHSFNYYAASPVSTFVHSACLSVICGMLTIGVTLGAAAEPESPLLAQRGTNSLGDLSFDQLAQIKVTTVSRTESTVLRSPAAVFVINPDMIRHSGATSIPELFRMVPGMNVARIDGNKWAVGVRGFNDRFSNKLLVQMDGRTVYNPVFSGVYWDDNATNRRILEELLRNWDMQPSLSASGQDALDLLAHSAEEGHPFKLVLLDAMMPGMDGLQLADHIRHHHKLSDTKLLMLSSAGPALDLERARALNIARCLTKPVKQSELLNAIVLVMGVPPRETEDRHEPSATAKAARPLKLLLAEDSLVNQRVAVRLLERRGHSVVIANNGTEAVAATDQEQFNPVLMDVHMQEMDGFQATGAIRAVEKERGGHLPIVAMTANAMKGDREKCLEAGMDDYIAKPIGSQELYEVVERMAELNLSETKA